MGGHRLSHGPANRGRRVLQAAAPLFVCRPASPPRGGVIVLHDVHGMTERVERACRSLALGGWLAVSPFLYHQRGGPAFEDAGTARAAMAELSPEDVAADVAAAHSYLEARAPSRPAVVGFGAGGHLAAWASVRHEVIAAAAVLPDDAVPRDDAAPPDGAARLPWPGVPAPDALVAECRAPWLRTRGDDGETWLSITRFLDQNLSTQ